MDDFNKFKELFDARFLVTPGCWLWTGSLTTEGYGRLKVRGRQFGAHRVSYELHVGPIPAELIIRHRCDNPRCVNPEHLIPGTTFQNMQDKVERNRQAKGSANGKSKLSQEQALEAIKLRRDGWTLQAIGDKYGITKQSVYAIMTRKNWKHLE